MAVKTIKVTEVVYLRLRGLKRAGESFSDLILRMTEGRGSVMHLAGSWKDMPRRNYERMVRALKDEAAISEKKMRRHLDAMLRDDR